jgi:hypothetical protein
MRFIVTKDFYSDEFRSQYIAGLKYTVREGNDKLAAALEKWVVEGKAEVIGDTHTSAANDAGAAAANVRGVGTVSDNPVPVETKPTEERPSLLRRMFQWL